MRGLGVRIEDVQASYGSHTVLRDVTLDVEPGEVVALLGPSGCGKTTLLRCVAGLETPTHGRVVIGDRDVTAGRGVPPEKRGVGMVFQDGALFPHHTVAANVGYGVGRHEGRTERRDAALRLVGLDELADRMPGTLSGGEQQRVALARALAPEPGVMLLDEPFSSLDAGLRGQLRSEVRQLLNDVAVTTVLVTHDQEEALTFGDRVAVMRHGGIEQFGTPEEIYGSPASPWVAGFVGEANMLAAEFGPAGAATVIGMLPAPRIGDGAGTVLCRPEQLALDNDSGGIVITQNYFGRDTRYEVDVDGARLIVRSAGPPAHAVGDVVSVRFTGTSAHGWPSGG